MNDTPSRIPFRGTLTADTFAAGQRLHAGRFYGCLLPAVVVFFALAMNALGISIRSWEAWPIFVVGLGFPLAYLLARRHSLARLYRQQPMLAVFEEGELSVDGLHTRSELGEATIPWRYITRSKSDAKVLLLYESPQVFIILPRDFFESDAQFRAAAEQARTWIAEARR